MIMIKTIYLEMDLKKDYKVSFMFEILQFLVF